MKKNIIVVLAVVVLLVGLGYPTEEVRDRGFVQSIAISSDTNHVYTSVTLYQDTNVYKGIGSSVTESLTSAELRQASAFFVGHTELLILYGGAVSEDILVELLEDGVSPNCAVVFATEEPQNSEEAYKVLKSYQRLEQLSIPTLANVVKSLSNSLPITIPLLNSDSTYSQVLLPSSAE